MEESIQQLIAGEIGTVAADKPRLSDIREEWCWVKDGVEKILNDNPQYTYIPEDVYAACVNEQAQLWTTSEGFVVTCGELDQFSGDKTCLIWIAYAHELGTKLVVKHMEFFEQAATEAGYDRLEVRTAVPELGEYILKQGWRLDTAVYFREL